MNVKGATESSSLSDHDYIVVGAGSSGAIVAGQLSANPRCRVLLLESGPSNKDPFVLMPKGMAKLMGSPAKVWSYETEAAGNIPSEPWFKGRMLGGSSSINGMMYFRGQSRDYNDWEAQGAHGWGWSEMGRVYQAMEDHSLGEGGGRGVGGPLGVTVNSDGNEISEAFIRASEQMGVPRVEDLNNPDQYGVGYASQTIVRGRRVSSARAFLDPALRRDNLTIETSVTVDRILFDGTRAVGVAATVNGIYREFRTEGEIILCAGAINSPAILQRSGVGDARKLSQLGIPVVADRGQVGEHLLEHRALIMYYELSRDVSENKEYRGLRLLRNALQYLTTHSGPLARAPYPANAFVRTMPDLDRPDVQIIFAPFVTQILKGKLGPDLEPSMQLLPYACRSRSEGYVRIKSSNPNDAPIIQPNYLADPYDREVSVRAFHFARELMRQPAIAGYIAKERDPIASLQTDEEIIDAFRSRGQSTFHSCGTCRMGDDPDAVLDEKLRVRGVSRLRVADASIMPTMPSCNTNGPALGIGWRAAEIILEGRNH